MKSTSGMEKESPEETKKVSKEKLLLKKKQRRLLGKKVKSADEAGSSSCGGVIHKDTPKLKPDRKQGNGKVKIGPQAADDEELDDVCAAAKCQRPTGNYLAMIVAELYKS